MMHACWAPVLESEQGGDDIEADDAEDAAVEYAKRLDDNGNEGLDGMRIHVRIEGDATVRVFRIGADYEPTFFADEVKA